MCRCLLLLSLLTACMGSAQPLPTLTSAQIVERSRPSDWRPLDPFKTLYLELDTGRVVIELAPNFAPRHVRNIVMLAQQRYFDGAAILRSQDNYVVQWGDPTEKRDVGEIERKPPAEYTLPLAADVTFTGLGDRDVYAPEVGWSQGMPVGRDSENQWLTHCYGIVGVGRDNPPDTGSGAELYVVIGHSPRHLDRNLALVGKVVQGMELLSALPRGKEALGFYGKPELFVPIRRVRLAADVPEAERSKLEVMRTDTQTWHNYVNARRFRRESFFVEPTGHVELCNVAVPVRQMP